MDLDEPFSGFQTCNRHALCLFDRKHIQPGLLTAVSNSAGPTIHTRECYLRWADSSGWVSLWRLLVSPQAEECKEGEAACRRRDYKWSGGRYES